MRVKENQVVDETKKFHRQENNTEFLYLKVAKLEEPIERQLQINMHLCSMRQALENQGEILQEKIDSRELVGYDIKHGVRSYLKKQDTNKNSNKRKVIDDVSSASKLKKEKEITDKDIDVMLRKTMTLEEKKKPSQVFGRLFQH